MNYAIIVVPPPVANTVHSHGVPLSPDRFNKILALLKRA